MARVITVDFTRKPEDDRTPPPAGAAAKGVHPDPDMAAAEARETYKGFRVSELRRLFDAAHEPEDWKAEISVFVPGELVQATVAAVEYFTATPATVELDQTQMRYLITSVGYRMGPAGP